MIDSKQLIKNIWRPDPDVSKRSDYFRFERNERTTLFSELEFNEILSTLSPYDLVAYGELEPFYEKICEWLKVDRKNILLSSGSDAGIKSVFETFVNEGDEVLISLPNYAMFSAYTAMFGGKEVQHIYEKNLTFDVERFIQKINPNTKLAVVSNPSHTGTVLSENEIIQIAKKAKSNNSLLLIDEAYHNFYPGTMVNYVDRFENLVITRTFSKAFGLASLRIGLLVGCKKIINELYKVKLVHEITGLATKIGCYFLDHLDIVDRYVEDVNLGKEVLYGRLKKIGFEVFKSEANFVYFKALPNIEPSHLKEYLETKKILIRGPFSNHPFDYHLRITVGDQNQMNTFCDELENYFIQNSCD